MSIPKIGGREARDLLRGTTPGPWEPEFEVGIYPALRLDADDEIDWMCAADRDLAIASPDLAQTIAWLYGREADEGEGPDESKTYYGGRGAWVMDADPGHGVDLTYELFRGMTYDETVDLARALLNAAEEVRNGAE